MSETVGESAQGRGFGKENLLSAQRRVEANGSAPGVDGMTAEAPRSYLKAHPGADHDDWAGWRQRSPSTRGVAAQAPYGWWRQGNLLEG
jgi:hypothetical protein